MTPPATLLGVCGVDREGVRIAPYVDSWVASGGRPERLHGMLEDLGEAIPIRGVISLGVCGALDPALKTGDVVVARAVWDGVQGFACDAGWSERLAGATGARPVEHVFGVDRPAVDPKVKVAVFAVTRAAVVDMESHVVARWAAGLGAPMAVLRVVSDDASRGLPLSALAGMGEDGRVDVGAVLAGLARRPWELPALIRTGRDSGMAFEALGKAAESAGVGMRLEG